MNRPDHPDPDVLETAGVRVREIHQLDESEPIEWRVGARIDSDRSSVFPLTAVLGSDERFKAFYKVIHPPENEGQEISLWAKEQKQSLIVGPTIEKRLRALAAGAGITFAATIAADPERLIHVTQAVDGRPLGRISPQLLTPRRRRRALLAARKAGTAAALIEACSPPGLENPQRTRGELVVKRRVERVKNLFSAEELRDLTNLITELQLRATEQADPVVYTHGDFNTENILVTEGRIGLIDSSWLPRLRHSDVAHFAMRIQYEPGMPRFWAERLVAALLDGYGDPEVTERPGWTFLRLSKLLIVVLRGDHSSRPWHKRLARRARSEIDEILLGN